MTAASDLRYGRNGGRVVPWGDPLEDARAALAATRDDGPDDDQDDDEQLALFDLGER